MVPGSKRPWSMSEVLVAQPLLLVPLRLLNDRTLPRGGWLPLGGWPLGRVTSGSGPAAMRVSPVSHGSDVSQDGHVSRAASTGAPHAGHLRAELTGGL